MPAHGDTTDEGPGVRIIPLPGSDFALSAGGTTGIPGGSSGRTAYPCADFPDGIDLSGIGRTVQSGQLGIPLSIFTSK